MSLPDRLREQLSLLSMGVVRDGSELVEDLTALASTLDEAVSGYAGLRLTLVHTEQPVQLTALLPTRTGREVVSSLGLALRPFADTLGEGGRLVVWSTVPGSLVDLAADLGYVLDVAVRSGASSSSVVELDSDLPLPLTGSGVVGLDELATIHRAAGLLVGRGHDPATVHQTLRDAAAGGGMTTHAWAARLLVRP